MTKIPLHKKTKESAFNSQNMGFLDFWTKMATQCKPQGPRFKNFGFWTKVAKVSKPQGPFWLLTLKKNVKREKLK
ncbi:hypothetical protein Hanom_Chr11g01020791 [Helianthus anomalus]